VDLFCSFLFQQLYFPLQSEKAGEQPERTRPSDSHKLLALLEQKRMLRRVYSQNIDGAFVYQHADTKVYVWYCVFIAILYHVARAQAWRKWPG
jgi:NAD-dependent SIR2 family protein deacetylase